MSKSSLLGVVLIIVQRFLSQNCYNENELELTFLFKDYLQRLNPSANFDMYTDICSKIANNIKVYSSVIYFKDDSRRMSDVETVEDAVMQLSFNRQKHKIIVNASFCKAGNMIKMTRNDKAFSDTFEIHKVEGVDYMYIGEHQFRVLYHTLTKERSFQDKHKSLKFGLPSIREIGNKRVNLNQKTVYKYSKNSGMIKMDCLEMAFERFYHTEPQALKANMNSKPADIKNHVIIIDARRPADVQAARQKQIARNAAIRKEQTRMAAQYKNVAGFQVRGYGLNTPAAAPVMYNHYMNTPDYAIYEQGRVYGYHPFNV